MKRIAVTLIIGFFGMAFVALIAFIATLLLASCEGPAGPRGYRGATDIYSHVVERTLVKEKNKCQVI